MKFVGITRFNLVTTKTLNSFRATRGKTIEEAKLFAFSEDRMWKRFSLFEGFCLQTYRMLTTEQEDCYGLILINKTLPKKYKTRLYELTARFDRIIITEVDDDARVSTIALRKSQEIANGDRLFNYRYDDDDALPLDFIRRIRSISTNEPDGTFVSMNIGYTIGRFSENIYRIKQKHYPMNAFGLGIFSSSENYQCIFGHGNHVEIKGNVYHDLENIGWLATTHDGNDSRLGEMKTKDYSAQEILGILSNKFPQISISSLISLPIRNY